jgi:hypothetical protein
LRQIEGFRNWGIEGLKDKIYNFKRDRIPSIPKFLNPSIPELDPGPILIQFLDVQRFTAICSN